MPGANEADLRSAIFALVEADNGVSGIVTLFKKKHPIVRWGSTGHRTKPIIALYFYDAAPRRPTDDPLDVFASFDIEVTEEDANTGLESKTADRLVAVLTNPAFTVRGLDVAPYWGHRRNLSEITGGQRLVVEARFKFNR